MWCTTNMKIVLMKPGQDFSYSQWTCTNLHFEQFDQVSCARYMSYEEPNYIQLHLKDIGSFFHDQVSVVEAHGEETWRGLLSTKNRFVQGDPPKQKITSKAF